MVRQILVYPDKRLREPSLLTLRLADEPRRIAEDLRDTLLATGNGVGLAAIQIGVAARLFAMRSPLVDQEPRLFWEPVIVRRGGGMAKLEESCLSLPGVTDLVDRYRSVELLWKDEAGLEARGVFDGLESHIIQHEVEHLAGGLFIDRLPSFKRKAIRRRFERG